MPKNTFVLVDDDQVPVSPAEVLKNIEENSLKTTANYYGVSVSTLRNFLKRNRVVTQKETRYVQLPESTPITMEIPQVPAAADEDPVVF